MINSPEIQGILKIVLLIRCSQPCFTLCPSGGIVPVCKTSEYNVCIRNRSGYRISAQTKHFHIRSRHNKFTASLLWTHNVIVERTNYDYIILASIQCCNTRSVASNWLQSYFHVHVGLLKVKNVHVSTIFMHHGKRQ